jgi:hypothetical protein
MKSVKSLRAVGNNETKTPLSDREKAKKRTVSSFFPNALKTDKKPLTMVLVVVCSFCGASCRTGESQQKDWTTFRLRWIASAAKHLSFEDVAPLKSIDDVLDLAVSKGGLPGKEGFQFDGWSRPFQSFVSKDNTVAKLRIISSGRNGLLEEGEGDDLYVDVTFFKTDQQPAVLQSWAK